MTKKTTLIIVACALLAMAGLAQAQSTTTLQVVVGPEAALTVTTGTTNLTTASTTFADNYTGTTALTYMIRTTKVGGSGSITVKITADFGPAGGPSVAAPASGDAMTYNCTVSAPGTACTGPVTAATSATSVATFGANGNSAKAGNSASLAWILPDDPAYTTGTYQATATFTISAA
jgi:hypothetical protein